MNEEQLVEVRRYSSEIEAELVVGRLEDAGIPCILSRNDAAGMLPSLQASSQGGFRLLVNPENLTAAVTLIDGFAARQTTEKIHEPQSSADSSVSASPVAKSGSVANLWITGFICLLLGIFLGIKYQKSQHSNNGEWTYDNNKDGRPDYWVTYRDGLRVSDYSDSNFDGKPDTWGAYEDDQLVSLREDRDLDGRPDHFWTYQHTVVSEGAIDTNFDGKPDLWERYSGGRLDQSTGDTDFDGRVDFTTLYQHGKPVVTSWKKAGSDQTWKRTVYHQGILHQELVDTNADGKFDTRRTFDAFAEITQTEKGAFD